MVCAFCSKQLSPSQMLKCSDICDRSFHYSCVGLSKYNDVTNWKCVDCTIKRKETTSVDLVNRRTFENDKLPNKKLENLIEEVKNLNYNLERLSFTANVLKKTSIRLSEEVEVMKEKLSFADHDYKLYIKNIENDLNELEQKLYQYDIEICGIPPLAMPIDIIIATIASFLQVCFNHDKVQNMYIKENNRFTNYSVVLTFFHMTDKQDWLNSFKSRGFIRTEEILPNLKPGTIIIKEHLTDYFADLLAATKNKCMKENLQWRLKNGSIFVTRGKYFKKKITNLTDLN